MIEVIVKYTKDEEMIEAHCLADEIKDNNPNYKVIVRDGCSPPLNEDEEIQDRRITERVGKLLQKTKKDEEIQDRRKKSNEIPENETYRQRAIRKGELFDETGW